MTVTTTITMVAQALAKLNAVMVLSLDLRSVILELTTLTLQTNVKPLAEFLGVVMVLSTSMKSVIMPLPVNLLLPAEITANSHIVVMELLTLFLERNVTLDFLETLISQQLDAQLDAHSTLVELSDPLPLETSTEPWPAQDASTPTLDLLLDHHAADQSNGWLPNQSKRSLNSKLTNSLLNSELESEEVKEVIVNLVTHTHFDHALASLKMETLLPLSELPAQPFPVNPLFKPPSMFSTPTHLNLPSSTKPSLLWSLSLSGNLSFSLLTTVEQAMPTESSPVKLRPSTTEDLLILLKQLLFSETLVDSMLMFNPLLLLLLSSLSMFSNSTNPSKF